MPSLFVKAIMRGIEDLYLDNHLFISSSSFIFPSSGQILVAYNACLKVHQSSKISFAEIFDYDASTFSWFVFVSRLFFAPCTFPGNGKKKK